MSEGSKGPPHVGSDASDLGVPERAQDRLYREWKMRVNIVERPQEDPLFASPDDSLLPPPLYNRLSDNPLGDIDAPVDDEPPRCFNCGELGHRLQDCTERRNRQRIASARMRFEAEGQLNSSWGSITGHTSIEERLAMLAAFSPGEVRGTVLREALGLLDFRDRGYNAPWLANLAEWGYPPGWFASYDPMAFLRYHITTGERGPAGSTLFVFGDAAVELLDLNPVEALETAPSVTDRPPVTEQQRPLLDSRSTHNLFPPRRRWAFYPFGEELPVYNGLHLPSTGINVSPIVISQPFHLHPIPPSMPAQPQPPPPLLPPPPLPPNSPPQPLLLHSSTAQYDSERPMTAFDEGEADMEMSSDSES